MSRRSKFTIGFEKIYPKDKSRSSASIAKHFNIKKSVLDAAYDRGVGAFNSNRSAVRKGVTSAEQWAKPRQYKVVLNILKARKGGNINMGTGQDGDLVERGK
jgi:hypothetical protein|tara:strand:- start:299 stop:604 length:306 start_codon:yes stop_codon:yes gene_type:complete